MRDDKVSDVPGSTYLPPRARECSRDYNSSSYLSLFLSSTHISDCHCCRHSMSLLFVLFFLLMERKRAKLSRKRIFLFGPISHTVEKGNSNEDYQDEKDRSPPLPTLVNKTSGRLRYIYISKALLLLLLPSIQPEFRAHLHGPTA